MAWGLSPLKTSLKRSFLSMRALANSLKRPLPTISAAEQIDHPAAKQEATTRGKLDLLLIFSIPLFK